MIYRCIRYAGHVAFGFTQKPPPKYNPMLTISKRGIMGFSLPRSTLSATDPTLLPTKTLIASIKVILSQKGPLSKKDILYIRSYLHLKSDPIKGIDVFIKINALGIKDLLALQKLLLTPGTLSPLAVLSNLHKLDNFKKEEVEGFDKSQECPFKLLPKYIEIFYKQAPDFVEQIVTFARQEIEDSRYLENKLSDTLLDIITELKLIKK